MCTAICGDSKVVGPEKCDNGADALLNIGCRNTCGGEYPGYVCSGGSSSSPSVCTEYCGN